MGVGAAVTKQVYCTIATRSHAPATLACLDSLRRHAPGAELVLLTIGDVGALPPTIHAIAVESCIPDEVLRGMRARYSTAELCFAAKPYLLAHLLQAGAAQVHYIDGDCLAFSSLAPLAAQLASADILLTPHALTPIPDDGRTPAPITLLRAGVFNAGYVGVRNSVEGLRFAHWLADMTREHAHNDPDRGMCGDQRWLDLVPALFSGVAICRHPGANVAYWNLHERALARDADGRFTANGEPLLFFHFSGYRPRRADALSVHQNRHAVVAGTALAQLLDEYGQRLRATGAPRGLSRLRQLLPARS
jgi:hypothetical protein